MTYQYYVSLDKYAYIPDRNETVLNVENDALKCQK